MIHRKFLYGLKPLPSGRFPLDAGQSPAYLFGNPSLQGGGNPPGSYPPGRSQSAAGIGCGLKHCFFHDIKESFLQGYDRSVQEWIGKHPQWAGIIAGSTVSESYVRSRLLERIFRGSLKLNLFGEYALRISRACRTAGSQLR
jgi:hypothetical protein